LAFCFPPLVDNEDHLCSLVPRILPFLSASPVFQEDSAGEFIIDVPATLSVQELHEFGISHEGADILPINMG
jgi:hypothetical protein